MAEAIADDAESQKEWEAWMEERRKTRTTQRQADAQKAEQATRDRHVTAT